MASAVGTDIAAVMDIAADMPDEDTPDADPRVERAVTQAAVVVTRVVAIAVAAYHIVTPAADSTVAAVASMAEAADTAVVDIAKR
jgi:hypothetical protein